MSVLPEEKKKSDFSTAKYF